MKNKIGLFFGTFNPVHIGHLILANHIVEHSDLDEVWFVITPMSPFKQRKKILDNYHRRTLVDIALEPYPTLKSSSIEFELPTPNYTINTLTYLEEKHANHDFVLILGEDNLATFPKWKNFDIILANYSLLVYPRDSKKEIPKTLLNIPKVQFIDAPKIEISSTYIRNGISNKKNIRPMLPYKVWKYIIEMNFYI